MAKYFHIMLWTIIIPWSINLGIQKVWTGETFTHPVFHTFMETFVSCMIAIIALISLNLSLNQRKSNPYHLLSVPYIILGVFAFFYSAYTMSSSSEWFLACGNLLGGLTYGLFVSRPDIAKRLMSLAFISSTLAMTLALAFLFAWFPSWVPQSSGGAISTVSLMNLIGALGFLYPWLVQSMGWGGKSENQVCSPHHLSILKQGLFLFTASLLAFDVQIWTASWWLMHLLKLIGFGWLLSEFYVLFSNKIKEVTHRKKRLEEILETTNNWIWEINSDFQILYSNQNVQTIIGYQPDEVIGQSMERFMSPKDFNKFQLECQWTSKELESKIIYTLVNNRGTSTYVERQIAAIYNSEGELIGYRGSDIDKTAQVLQDKELMLAENIVENTWDAIIATDLHDRTIKVNRAFERLTGVKGEDIVGAEGSLLRQGAEPPEFYLEVWNHINTHGYWSGEMKAQNSFGFEFPIEMNITCARDQEGKVLYYLGVFSDISKRKESEKQLKNLAYYDQLTSLPNRRSFQELFQFQIENARRSKKSIGMFYLDLDNFKDINDTMGHDVGDQYLIETARRIESCIRKSDMACRLGGDEFTLLLNNISNESDVTKVAENLMIAISKPFTYKHHQIQAGGSLGIALYPRDGQDYHTLSKNADIAMFRAKKAGKNQFCYFQEIMNREVRERVDLENEMKKALENGEFQMYYQPKVDLQTHKIIGAEALIRWIHPNRGMISPFEFIPVAEDTGMIVSIGQWILEESIRQAKYWQDNYLPDFSIAINLSVKQFRSGNLNSEVKVLLEEFQIKPSTVDLELTESVFALEKDDIYDMLRKFKDLGVKISLDDFGTGYSSLSYLKNFPIDVIKIDKSFVKDLGVTQSDDSIVDAIISMSHSLGLDIVAEGVETLEHAEFLATRQCQYAQGFYFSRPVPALELENLFKEGKLIFPPQSN